MSVNLKIPVTVGHNERLINSVDSIFELHYSYFLIKQRYKYEKPKDADDEYSPMETALCDFNQTMKAMYAKKPLLDKEGEPICDVESGEMAYMVQDTRDMSTIEALEFTENVRMFARDFLMLELPLPAEQIEINLKTK